MSSLHGKTALVTGGTTGIGLATARLFHAEGARVAITGSNADSLAAARKQLPPDVLVLRADVRSVDDTARLADELRAAFGGLDVVFLNAGVARFAPLDAFDERFFDDQFDVNVKGALFTLQKVLPLLRTGASVLFNSSVVAHKGVPGASVYTATKGAVSAMVRSLAAELATRGIRVNAISPGPITTPIYDKMGLAQDAKQAFQDGMTAKVPLSRFGEADEVARTALFLASSASSYITGADLDVGGGIAAV